MHYSTVLFSSNVYSFMDMLSLLIKTVRYVYVVAGITSKESGESVH